MKASVSLRVDKAAVFRSLPRCNTGVKKSVCSSGAAKRGKLWRVGDVLHTNTSLVSAKPDAK